MLKDPQKAVPNDPPGRHYTLGAVLTAHGLLGIAVAVILATTVLIVRPQTEVNVAPRSRRSFIGVSAAGTVLFLVFLFFTLRLQEIASGN